MVVVPHEDDEINLAGASIYEAKQEHIRVICVFVTNGDWQYPAFVRIEEAVKALGCLGVPEEDIIFLGYPDGGGHAEKSIFHQTSPKSDEKHTETYGTKEHPDFAYNQYGHHVSYTWRNLLSDLENVILAYKPGAILATDFDRHPDHRMTSLAFDTAMGQILNKTRGSYQPVVLKGFCYSTSFESVADFENRHLLSSVVNKAKLQDSNFETDNPAYEWNKRIRIPVPYACRTRMLRNVIFKALCAHVSQKAIWKKKPQKIINGDQVFWQRRTDNLIYQGRVSVSSGNGKYLHDFKTMDTNDISGEKCIYGNYLWIPDQSDTEKWCRCDFRVPQRVECIAFYGNIDADSLILRGILSFSNGYSQEVINFQEQGHATIVHIPPQDDVKWVKFQILEMRGAGAGISEWVILAAPQANSSFAQICSDGNFAYDWYIYKGEHPEISAYTYGMNSPLNWYLNGQLISLDKINNRIGTINEKISIRVEVQDNSQIWCEATFSNAGIKHRIMQVTYQMLDRLGIWWEKQMEKRPHHKLKKLKE